MSGRSCIPVGGRSNTEGKKKTVSSEVKSSSRAKRSGTCRLRLPGMSELSSVKYLKRFGDKVVSIIRHVSTRTRSSTKISSSASATTSKPCLTPIDSRREEAISDCIEFINASASSLPRSNSVSC